MSEQIMVTVGEKEYPLIKRGRAQAEQVSQLLNWLSVYGSDFFASVTDSEGNISLGSIPEIITKLAGVVNTNALMELYMLVTGCSMEEADEYFDIAQMIDVAIELFEKQPSFKKVINRFFSRKPSIEDTAEQSMN